MAAASHGDPGRSHANGLERRKAPNAVAVSVASSENPVLGGVAPLL